MLSYVERRTAPFAQRFAALLAAALVSSSDVCARGAFDVDGQGLARFLLADDGADGAVALDAVNADVVVVHRAVAHTSAGFLLARHVVDGCWTAPTVTALLRQLASGGHIAFAS